MKIDQVLNEYRRGDADKRMSLCLYYREFRDEFSGIELADPMDLETSRLGPPLRRLLSAILTFFKNTLYKRDFFQSIVIPTGWYDYDQRIPILG